MDCLPGLSGRLAHLQSSNILTTKMKSLLAELNMRYFNSANRFNSYFKYTYLNFNHDRITPGLEYDFEPIPLEKAYAFNPIPEGLTMQ